MRFPAADTRRKMSTSYMDVPLGIRLIQKVGTKFSSTLQVNRVISYRFSVLILTYLCYICYHLTRKPMSVVKSVLHRNCSEVELPSHLKFAPNESTWCDYPPFDGPDSAALLGYLDSAFLFSYGSAMFVSGLVAERVSLRYFLAFGMLLSAIFTYLFGLGKTYDIHSIWYFVFVQAMAGICQTTGWPGVVTVVTRWFGKSKRGLIFGIWNSHMSIGNILGSLIAAYYVETDWALSFIVPAIIMGVIGILLFLFLVDAPEIVGCQERPERKSAYRNIERGSNDNSDVDDTDILVGEQGSNPSVRSLRGSLNSTAARCAKQLDGHLLNQTNHCVAEQHNRNDPMRSNLDVNGQIDVLNHQSSIINEHSLGEVTIAVEDHPNCIETHCNGLTSKSLCNVPCSDEDENICEATSFTKPAIDPENVDQSDEHQECLNNQTDATENSLPENHTDQSNHIEKINHTDPSNHTDHSNHIDHSNHTDPSNHIDHSNHIDQSNHINKLNQKNQLNITVQDTLSNHKDQTIIDQTNLDNPVTIIIDRKQNLNQTNHIQMNQTAPINHITELTNTTTSQSNNIDPNTDTETKTKQEVNYRPTEHTPMLDHRRPSEASSTKSAIGFVGALKIPGVVEFSLCLFFSKLVSYTFLYWLPLYIQSSTTLGATKSADLSTLFDFGGIVGAITAGLLSDYTGMSACTCSVMLIWAVPMLLVYQTYGATSLALNIFLLFIVGILVNGPYALITTSVSAELGTHSSLEGNSKALATVTAIIDGTGSIGAAVGPLLAGLVSSSGWENVFYMLMISDIIALVLLIRLVCKEIARFKRNPRID